MRHGEVDNPQRLVYGRLPGFGLTSLGKKQAAKAGRYLKSLKIKPEIIITSPLLRTKTTAKILGEFFSGVEIVEERAIIEGDLGWEGKVEANLVKKGIWEVYLNAPNEIKTGETFAGIQKRGVEWLESFLSKEKYSEFVIVSHKDVIRTLTVFLEGRPLDDFPKIPCNHASVTSVVIDQKLKLLKPVVYWEPEV